ncbi:hypothetical protein [Streptomyces sp. NPDC059708]|uniref:hypothetical protein n=1 Tax=Streptomyces sp. NPDC059708 TaxID=3346916 RepID=UPI00368BF6C2
MPVSDIVPLSPDFDADPHSFFAKLRAAGPVHLVSDPNTRLSEPYWLVVGYEEARAALTHPGLRKDWHATDMFPEFERTAANANMLESDPPHHTRLRRLVAREFTARRVEAMRPPGGGGGAPPMIPIVEKEQHHEPKTKDANKEEQK